MQICKLNQLIGVVRHCRFSTLPPFRLPPSVAVCCLGLSAFLTQLTLMRELFGAFCGNELVVGIVLGPWMLLTGIGSTLGKTASRLRSPIVAFVAAEILIALLPVADVFLLRWLRNVVFLRGAEVGVAETAASCFVLLAPYCLVTGYVLTLACQAAGTSESRRRVGQANRCSGGSSVAATRFAVPGASHR